MDNGIWRWSKDILCVMYVGFSDFGSCTVDETKPRFEMPKRTQKGRLEPAVVPNES